LYFRSPKFLLQLTAKKNAEALVVVSKETGIEVNGDKTNYMVILMVCICMATLTEVFPCFFLNCKANARVKPAKTGHGPHCS